MNADQLYTDWQRRLPGWAFRGLTRHPRRTDAPLLGQAPLGTFLLSEPVDADDELHKDPVYGPLAEQFEQWYKWFANLMRATRILDAEGPWLDLHAWDRGLYRHPQEADDRLRVRIRTFPEVATERALHAAVTAVLGPGLPAAWGRCHIDSAFYGRTRIAPEIAIDVFTLRYRFLAWTGGPIPRTARLRAWGRGARWGRYTFPDKPRLPRRSFFFSSGFYRAGTWTRNNSLRNEREPINPFAVSVVIVPPQLLYVRTFWRTQQWQRHHWGHVAPDLPKYRAIRNALEQTRAAGTEAQIWIRGDS